MDLLKKQEKAPVFPTVESLRELQGYDRVIVSTDQCVQKDETDTTLGEVLPDPSQNVMESVGYNHLNKQLMALLKEAIPAEDEFGMFCMRYGLTGDGKFYTLQEISDFYRDSQKRGKERVRQILDRIMNWLQIGSTLNEDGNQVFYIDRLREMSLLLPSEG
jgi:DNA-directed RNA polymerase sigma subunit (sigma70/sigma32)